MADGILSHRAFTYKFTLLLYQKAYHIEPKAREWQFWSKFRASKPRRLTRGVI